jgi:N4-gp56 family major capsid protein
MPITTTTEVDPAVSTYYDRVLLERALPFLVHDQFAEQRNIPSKSGNTIKFRRYSSLTTATTPLTEGQTPNGQKLAKLDLTATIAYYGDFVTITDVIDLTVEDPVLTVEAELLGEQSGETRDELTKDMLAATASLTNASSGTNGATPTEINKADIQSIVQALLGNKARMIRNVVTAGRGIGTTPVRAAFWGILHSDLITPDLEDVSEFLHTSKYPTQSTILESEWGSTGNVRWVYSTNAEKTSGSPDTYKLPIIGRNGYAITSITGGILNNIVKNFGSGEDPLNQRATSGWKFPYVSRILNDSFLHILKVTKQT